MSLYVRVFSSFYTHRKTVRLRSLIGDDALWLPPRIWSYAAENQPDGCFKDYNAAELALLVGYNKDASSMLQALLQAGFMDPDPLRIHDWAEHNGYHKTFSERASKAAIAKWAKEKTKGIRDEKIGNEMKGDKHCLTDATSMFDIAKAKLNALFSRPENQGWDYVEESGLVSVMRRESAMAELAELEKFKHKPDSYFPQSISRLLTTWSETLDRARNHATNQRTSRQGADRNAGTANNPNDYANVQSPKILR